MLYPVTIYVRLSSKYNLSEMKSLQPLTLFQTKDPINVILKDPSQWSLNVHVHVFIVGRKAMLHFSIINQFATISKLINDARNANIRKQCFVQYIYPAQVRSLSCLVCQSLTHSRCCQIVSKLLLILFNIASCVCHSCYMYLLPSANFDQDFRAC